MKNYNEVFRNFLNESVEEKNITEKPDMNIEIGNDDYAMGTLKRLDSCTTKFECKVTGYDKEIKSFVDMYDLYKSDMIQIKGDSLDFKNKVEFVFLDIDTTNEFENLYIYNCIINRSHMGIKGGTIADATLYYCSFGSELLSIDFDNCNCENVKIGDLTIDATNIYFTSVIRPSHSTLLYLEGGKSFKCKNTGEKEKGRITLMGEGRINKFELINMVVNVMLNPSHKENFINNYFNIPSISFDGCNITVSNEGNELPESDPNSAAAWAREHLKPILSKMKRTNKLIARSIPDKDTI